jgi:hypothetical protein
MTTDLAGCDKKERESRFADRSGARYEERLEAPSPAQAAAGESYAEIDENAFMPTAEAAISTFAIDVDTASYSNVRRFLNDGVRPPTDAVRIEELVNYFNYDYPDPSGDVPFSVTSEIADCPWNDKARLVHIGLQAQDIAGDQLPARNLVFLLDVSGSMESPDKLPLLRRAMKLMVEGLDEDDHVAIVVYAGAAGVVLDPTSGADQQAIMAALDRLQAGGSTNGGDGIERAYALARANYQPRGPRAVDRARARVRRVLVGARARDRQPAGLDDGAAGRQGQRQLRVPRLDRRGAQGAGRGGWRDAGDRRQGCEDPGRVRSRSGRVVPADWL